MSNALMKQLWTVSESKRLDALMRDASPELRGAFRFSILPLQRTIFGALAHDTADDAMSELRRQRHAAALLYSRVATATLHLVGGDMTDVTLSGSVESRDDRLMVFLRRIDGLDRQARRFFALWPDAVEDLHDPVALVELLYWCGALVCVLIELDANTPEKLGADGAERLFQLVQREIEDGLAIRTVQLQRAIAADINPDTLRARFLPSTDVSLAIDDTAASDGFAMDGT